MTEEKLYKIMELSTSGWFLVENRAQMLTKEQCDASLTEYQKQHFDNELIEKNIENLNWIKINNNKIEIGKITQNNE